MIWGPASPEASLRDRIARYISAPLSPVEVRELPCDVSFRHAPRQRVGDRPGPDPRRLGLPPRADARLPDRRRRLLAHLHPRPRARARRRPRPARGRLDLRLRPRPRHLAADPRRPVHRRRVPRPHRLGPLAAARRARLRPPHRRRAHRPLPPRPDALRRLPRPLRRSKRRSAGRRWAATRRRSSWAPSGPSTSCRRGRRAPSPPPEPVPLPRVRLGAMPSSTIEAAAAESELIGKALAMAEAAHAGQTRNGSGGMAYIHHPVAVAELLAEHGFDEQAVAAALLHDVVEDSEASVEDVARALRRRRSRDLVAALTEDESIEPFERRKEAHRRHVDGSRRRRAGDLRRRQALQHPRPAPRPRQRRRGGRRRVRGAAGGQGTRSGRPTWRCCAARPRPCPSSTTSPVELTKLREARATASSAGPAPPSELSRRFSGSRYQNAAKMSKARAPVTSGRRGAEEDVGDQHDRPGHRQRQGAEAGDREAVGEEDELVLLLHAEGDPVVGGGRDQQHRGDRGQQQRHEVDRLLEGGDLR